MLGNSTNSSPEIHSGAGPQSIWTASARGVMYVSFIYLLFLPNRVWAAKKAARFYVLLTAEFVDENFVRKKMSIY